MSRNLSICFVSQEYPEETGWGGIGTYTWEIAHGLARMGHRIIVVSRALHKEQLYLESDNVLVYRILPHLSLDAFPVIWRFNRIWEGYHLAIALKLNKLINQHPIDIIEVPAIHGETILFQYSHPSFPVVVRIHSCMPKAMKLSGSRSRAALRVSLWCERRAVAMAHGLTAPSHSIVRDNFPYLPIKRDVPLQIIPNPVDTNLFAPAACKFACDKVKLLYVGRIEQRKGAHILAKAIPLILLQHPETQFIFAGRDGQSPDGGSMKNWILDTLPPFVRPNIVFLDHLPRQEIISLYQEATIVTSLSVNESFGYVCVEAMASEKLLISTRSGGPEEIVEDGRTGFLVPVNDSVALANKVVEALNDRPRIRAMGGEGRQKVLNEYSTEVVAMRTTEFYNSVLRKARRYDHN